jgi:hypothetical protein
MTEMVNLNKKLVKSFVEEKEQELKAETPTIMSIEMNLDNV